jgi:hypothetical protein
VLSKEKMYPIIFDLARADAMTNFSSADSIGKIKESIRLYEEVFQIHGVTKEKFAESLNFYERNPEILKVMMDSLRAYERRVLATEEKPVIKPVRDKNKPVEIPMPKPVRE